MPSGYNGNGTIPFATTGAGMRVAITGSTDATPIVVHAPSHGFNTSDTVEIEGHAVNLNANGLWQILKVDADHFSLNSSIGTGAGAGSGGYAIGYEIQPGYQIAGAGEAASMVTLAPVLQGLANTVPFGYRNAGKHRIYNLYNKTIGTLSPPFVASAWSSQNVTTTTPETLMTGALSGATTVVTALSATDNPGFAAAPQFTADDVISLECTFTFYVSGGTGVDAGVGFRVALVQGGSIQASGGLITPFFQYNGGSNQGNYYPAHISALFAGVDLALPTITNPVSFGLTVQGTTDSTNTVTVFLVGAMTWRATQYRAN